MGFPIHRLRRLRRTENLRRMVRRTHLSVDDLVMPLFVCPGKNVRKEIASMPGNAQLSVDLLVEECVEIESLGIPAVLLFGIPETKDAVGTSGTADDGIVQQAVRAVKKRCDKLLVITDVCMCEYTDHGHCGILRQVAGSQEVDNDKTLDRLADAALSHANAGADIVAPSDMMDGRIGRIRNVLDKAGFEHVVIISYAAKFTSAFYGPFRDAAESPPQFGDRKGYQMDFCNSDEAMREIALDIEEGADIVMVKPALAYLDIIYRARREFDVPIACYSVSGEFAMLKAAAKNGWIDERKATMESLIAMKRAGSDIIITYHAKDAVEWLSS